MVISSQVLTKISWAAGLMGLLLIFALATLREQKTAHRLLIAAILCSLYRQWLIGWEVGHGFFSHRFLVRSSFPLELTAIAAIYLYLKAMVTPGFSITRRQLCHLIPGGIGLLWYGILLKFGSESLFYPSDALTQERYLRLLVKMAVVVPYLFLVGRDLKTFRLQTYRNFSSVDFPRLRWLTLILGVVYLMVAIDVLDVVTGPGLPVWHLVPVGGFMALAAVTIFTIRYSAVFAAELKEVQDTQETEIAKLSVQELDRLKEKLLELLEKEKLYLDPELRLSQLAEALRVRPYKVSEVLGRGLNTSFYELIGKYRIQKAQAMLLDPTCAHLNLLGIGLESGFKSKSVFNDTFKKITGKTPSQFRQEPS